MQALLGRGTIRRYPQVCRIARGTPPASAFVMAPSMEIGMKFFRSMIVAAFAAASAGCAGSGAGGNGGQGAVLPGPAGAQVAQSRIPSGPTICVMHAGTVLHVDLPPWQRPARPFTAPVQYHGGMVIDQSVMYAIYWKPKGFFMSRKYMPTIDRFFNDVGAGTKQYDILTQYGDTDGFPLNSSSLGGTWVDHSPFPTGMNDLTVQDEVRKAIRHNGWPAGGYQPIFVVFTASKAKVNFALCAYHANFLMHGQRVAYSIVPYQHDIGPHGCGTPTDVWPNDRDADQTIDTLWHEEAEAISDPVQAWWRDTDGSEIGDICETTYAPRGPDGGNVTDNGDRYITQELQSNLDGTCVEEEP